MPETRTALTLALLTTLVFFDGRSDEPLPIAAAVPSVAPPQRSSAEDVERLLKAATDTFRSPLPAPTANEPEQEMELRLQHPHIEVRCSHPSMDRFPAALRPAIRANLKEAFSRAEGWFRDYLETLEEEEFTLWKYQELWGVTGMTPRLASLMGKIRYYNGGAHSNYDDIGWTVWDDGSGPRVLQLGDLFSPCTFWAEALATRVIRQLKEHDNTSASDGFISDILEDYLEPWVLTPKGIEFHFAAGTMGCFGRGPVEAFVSYEEIRDLLNPLGPAAEFLR